MTSFLDRFTERVEAAPSSPAVEDGTAIVTYAELRARALELAGALQARGAGPEVLVALHLPRSIDFVVSVLATWYADAAFVPFDPLLPKARLQSYCDEAKPAILISRGSSLHVATHLSPDASGTSPERIPDCPERQLAYVVFTSGSSGRPKGVQVEHRGIVPLLDAQISAFDLHPKDRCLWSLSVGFDASLSDIGTALLSGSTLVVSRGGLHVFEELETLDINYADIPPSLLSRWDPKTVPNSLRTLVIGGEVCPADVVRRWASNVQLFNVYGPTETTVCSSVARCTPDWSSPSIGVPIPGTDYRIHDPNDRAVPGEGSGELLIGGKGVARGYIGRPELDAERFTTVGGRRYYRTGDHVRRSADGRFEFLGRLDRQLKLRGFRIEPEEIERHIVSRPDVREAMVFSNHSGRLVAAFASTGCDWTRLRAHLRERLPRWMCPSEGLELDELPKGANGKVDISALVARLPRPSAAREAPMFDSQLANALSDAWSEVLGKPVGFDEDIDALGADSLDTLMVVGVLQTRGFFVAPAALCVRGSIREMAERLKETGQRSGAELLEEANALELRPNPASGPGKAKVVTGATGFLGSHVLDILLRETDAPIFVLVRGRDDDHLQERLRAARRRFGLDEELPFDRLEVFAADLERPQLGLTTTQRDRISLGSDEIYHCAARVNLSDSYSRARPANLLGTQRMLDLATPRHSFHYASTLSVFVAADPCPSTCLESHRLRDSQPTRIAGGYAQSKFAAEALVERAAEMGIRASIHRFGLVTGHSTTGIGPRDDLLAMSVKGLARLGMTTSSAALKFDVTPVDFAAEAMVKASLRFADRQDPVATYHITNAKPASLDELNRALDEVLSSVALRRVSPGRLFEAIERRPSDLALAIVRGALCRLEPRAFVEHRALDLFAATNTSFDRRALTSAIGPLDCPKPSAELLRRYVRRILE